MSGCGCASKVRHETYLSALKARASMRDRGKRGPLRIYRCRQHRCWHLTSRPATWKHRKSWPVGHA